MIKKIQLLNKDEIYAVLGIQDRNLRALEKEFKVALSVKQEQETGGAEISVSGIHSRVDKVYSKIKK